MWVVFSGVKLQMQHALGKLRKKQFYAIIGKNRGGLKGYGRFRDDTFTVLKRMPGTSHKLTRFWGGGSVRFLYCR